MTVQSTVAHSLDVTDGIIRYNAACKRILSEKVILAYLLKVCVVEYEGCDISEVVQSISDDGYREGRVIGKDSVYLEVGYSKIEYDILKDICVPGSDEKIYVNIEAQNNYYPGYPLSKRVEYYAASLAMMQGNVNVLHGDYGKLWHSYSIWVCLNPPKNLANGMAMYERKGKQLIGNVELQKDFDLSRIVMIWIGEYEEGRKDIIGLLSLIFSRQHTLEEKKRIIEKDFEILMSIEIGEEVEKMCNLGEGLVKETWDKAIIQGKHEGKAEGMAVGEKIGKTKGAEERLVQDIYNFMKSFKLDKEVVMDGLKIPKHEQGKYLKMLERLDV